MKAHIFIFLLVTVLTSAADILLFEEKRCKGLTAQCRNIKPKYCCHLPHFRHFKAAFFKDTKDSLVVSDKVNCTKALSITHGAETCVWAPKGPGYRGAFLFRHTGVTENVANDLRALDATECLGSVEAEVYHGEF